MKIFIPIAFQSWVDTKPTEGQLLLVALITKLHLIYGPETYFEFYNEDLDTLNWTSKRGDSVYETRRLHQAGVLNRANGINGRLTCRLNNEALGKINRIQLGKNGVWIPLSQRGALLWSYLMGRMANVDAETEIQECVTVREFSSSDHYVRYAATPKHAQSHVLPEIYRHQFNKAHADDLITRAETEEEIYTDKQAYAKSYYAKNRAKILASKKYKNGTLS